MFIVFTGHKNGLLKPFITFKYYGQSVWMMGWNVTAGSTLSAGLRVAPEQR